MNGNSKSVHGFAIPSKFPLLASGVFWLKRHDVLLPCRKGSFHAMAVTEHSHEHVFRTAKSNTFSPNSRRLSHRGVSALFLTYMRVFFGQVHDGLEVFVQGSFRGGNFAKVNFSRGAI